MIHIYNKIADLILYFFPLYILFNLSENQFVFLLGYIISYLFNGILKFISRYFYQYQDIICRPNQECNLDTYVGEIGMPSGHTQVIAYCAGFLANTEFPNISLFFSLLMPILRVLGEKHTILQTIIGYIVGYLSGYYFKISI